MSYVRVSIMGTVGGAEKWSVNPVFDPTAEFGTTVDQVKLDAAALAIAMLSPGNELEAAMSTAATITGCRLEVRDDVTNALLGISVQNRPTPLAGSIAPRLPAQAAVVCSLRTNTPGASGRGRIYWPALGSTIDTGLRLSSPPTANLIAQFKTYFAAMDTALSTQFAPISFDLAVRSTKTSSTPHVARLQVGNIIDTQRRRRDTLVEAYATVAYP
jgi:hypothetical protein